MTNGRYILKGHETVECDDLMEWANYIESETRHVGDTMVGGVRISTVFLGLDHSFGGERPVLFETMIFGGEHDEYQERYSTWDEAEVGHAAAVKLVETSAKG
jgi:hypothetical protein